MRDGSRMIRPSQNESSRVRRDMLKVFIIYKFVLWKSVRHKKKRAKAKRKIVSNVILLPIIIRSISSIKILKYHANQKHSDQNRGSKRNHIESERWWRVKHFFRQGEANYRFFFSPFFFTTCRARGHLLDVFLLLINNGKNSYYYTLEYMKQRLSEWNKKKREAEDECWR